MRFLTCFVALYLCATAASAATYVYVLDDHPDGNQQHLADYGLRLDSENKFFTFQQGNARLTYDDVAGTAVISGFVNESTGNLVFDPTNVAITYTMTEIMDVGGGFFKAREGQGSVGDITLFGTGMDEFVFKFLQDGYRLGDHQPFPTDIVGRGWIDAGGTNDFLLTATLVPIPAAVWLFGSALLAFFGFARRKTAA